jgi:YVTN family beta-propeller protein
MNQTKSPFGTSWDIKLNMGGKRIDAGMKSLAGRGALIGALCIFDAVSHAVVGSLDVAPGPLGVAAMPDGKQVYVTSPGAILNNNGFFGNTVSVINTPSNSLDGTINVGTGPIGVAFTPDGKSAYVGNNNDNTVSVINTAANTVVSAISLGRCGCNTRRQVCVCSK